MIRIVPVTLAEANATVAEWHSHHKPVVGHLFSSGAIIWEQDSLVDVLGGVVIVSRPVAQALQDGFTWEVTRLCCRRGDKNVASKLLGSATSTAEARGIRWMVSYTRDDEDGVCYKAAGWVRLKPVKGRPHNSGNRRLRYLPGFYTPSTEIVNRWRWEWRPPQAIRAVCKCIFALGEWARAVNRKNKRAA